MQTSKWYGGTGLKHACTMMRGVQVITCVLPHPCKFGAGCSLKLDQMCTIMCLLQTQIGDASQNYEYGVT